MKKTTTTILLFIFLLLAFAGTVSASVNNKFGMSLLQPTDEDIKNTANLINGETGSYGYVTLVIQENDRNKEKWQGIFEKLRESRLIPIIRLATQPEGESWRRPKAEDVAGWVEFLDSLNWVVKTRYIVLFNEPNHASEWGGAVDGADYARVASHFAQKLHEKNNDFFIMLAGFDASAPSYPDQYEDEAIFLNQAYREVPSLFEHIEGWSSHSYPNPAFSGSPWDTGRKSIRGYIWELEFIKNTLGVSKDLPVFITETGWINRSLSRDMIASYFKTAFTQVWGPDARVFAVTPFVFDYQTAPFLGFSWKRQGDSSFYPQYDAVKMLEKTKGEPEIIEAGTIVQQLPAEFVENSSYHFTLKLKNTGQAIWDIAEGYRLVFNEQRVPFEYFFSDIKGLRPFEDTDISIYIKTKKEPGTHSVSIGLEKNGNPIAKTTQWNFTIVPLPTLRLQAPLFLKLQSNVERAEVQIFDENEGLMYKKSGLSMKGGLITVSDVQNIVLGKTYRIVLIAPYYLPRQSVVAFKKNNNTVYFKPLLPFDFNRDGKLDWSDLSTAITKPSLIRLLLP